MAATYTPDEWAKQALRAVLARAFLAAAKEHQERADEARRMGEGR